MKARLTFLLVLVTSLRVFAQSPDSALMWADALLLDEVPYPVIARLERAADAHRSLAAANRLSEAYLLSLDFMNAEHWLKTADSLVGKSVGFEAAYYHQNQSRFDYEKSDYGSSVDHALTCLHLIGLAKNPATDRLRAESVLQLGKSYLQQKKLDDARIQLDIALAYYRKDSANCSIKLGQTCFALGLWSKVRGQLEASAGYYHRAILLFELSQHERYYDLGRCYNNLASVFSEQGDYGNAQSYYLKALDIKRKHVTDSVSLAITYNNLGKFYSDYGNNYKARDSYEKSIALLNPLDPRSRERLPEFLNNFGGLLADMDEQALAEKYFRECLEILKNQPPQKSFAPSLSLAGLLMLQGRFQEPERLLDNTSWILSDGSATRRNQALWQLRKANLLGMQGKIADADQCYAKAIGFSEAGSLLTAEILVQRGQLCDKKKQYRNALHDFLMASSIVSQNLSPDHPQLCTHYNLAGECYVHLGQPDSAIYYCNLAIDRNMISGPTSEKAAIYPLELITSCYLLSLAYEQRFRATPSAAHLEKGLEYVELGLRAIDARRKSLSVTNDQLIFDERISVFFERAMDAYTAALGANGGSGILDKAFFVSELAKSQSLGQALKESNLRSFSNVSSTVRSVEENLQKQIQSLDLQTLKELKYGDEANADLVQEYKKGLQAATDHYRRLQDSIRVNLPGYYQLKYNKTLVKADEIQHDILLHLPHSALIEFCTGDSAIFCHVITAESQQLFKIGSAGEIKSRILAFRNQIKLGLDAEVKESAAWLYARLFGMADQALQGKSPIRRLVIVPDQILCYLPFEALIRNPANGKFLIEDYEISYGYSATLLWQKYMEKATRKAESFVGLAPEFSSNSRQSQVVRDEAGGETERFDFQPLTGNKMEVDAIRSRMEKKQIRGSVLEGKDATEESFRKLNLKEYDFVHFATHGFVNMDHPERSGVAFSHDGTSTASDGILFTNEVYEMQFNAQLVCLSSCDSGLGKLYRGEGMIGLAQAFLFAGARNLAVSLWKVDDTATRDLMIDFYGQIPARSFASALTSAKRKMAASRTYHQPYYWSSFVLIGF